MLVEVIATTRKDALDAMASGADRIELVTGMAEDGLTPSIGLISEVISVATIPIHVMVRPHSQSFCYDADDIRTMVQDILAIKRAGAQGIVIGAITAEGRVDMEAMMRFTEVSHPLPLTFHRAFDHVVNMDAAIEQLMELPTVRHVLTSGGEANAFAGAQRIAQLVTRVAGSKLSILAGGGLTVAGLDQFVERTHVEELHFGRGVRRDERMDHPFNPEAIRHSKALVAHLSDPSSSHRL